MPRTDTTLESRSSKAPQIPPAISFKLSDKHFLDLGWTSKPYITLALPAVVMRAKFSHRVISPWFQERDHNVREKYRDGKKLYFAKANGTGKIYYPNGKIAIKVEKGGVNQFRTRVWVYGPGEVDKAEFRPAQLCALFDSLGNGVVYDKCMKKRLLYNQKEGVLWDSPNGMPIIWKWHNFSYDGSMSIMNDEDEPEAVIPETPKPVLFARSVEIKSNISKEPESSLRLSRNEIAFLENMEHRKYINTGKMMPKEVSPIKPIVIQLNSYIALRVWDQSDITLTFFAKNRHTELKIGVLYNPIDKLKVAEVDPLAALHERVMCPFESFPPKTKSMVRLKKMVESFKADCHSPEISV